jgi:hypothetical protein
VKKTFAIFLLLITAIGSFTPCCQSDDCAEETISTHHSPGQEDEKGICSPFFACGTCSPAIVITNLPVLIEVPETEDCFRHPLFFLPRLSTYHPSFFQPPRIG